MKRLDTESFIIRGIAKHNLFYNYSKTIYVNQRTPVVIICPTHGEFEQIPELHMRGQGCKKCGDKAKNKDRKDSYSTFNIKAIKEHSDFYEYVENSYISNRVKMQIICPVHSIFEQTPESHLNGRGCPICGIESRVEKRSKSTDQFLLGCLQLPDRGYDYSRVKYKTSLQLVEIICPDHGVFKQAPKLHLVGHGCPKCAKSGYKLHIPGVLYVLKFENITKIGITNISAYKRAKDVSKSSGRRFEVLLAIKFSDGAVPDQIETRLLKSYRESHRRVEERFDGNTECFYDVNYDELQNKIINLCSELLPAQTS